MPEYLSREQRRALETLLASKGHRSERRIRRRTGSGPAPLSSAQRRFWFLHQLDPASGRLNTPVAIEVRGALDVALFDTAFRVLVRRHEILRTAFPLTDGAPAQVCRDVEVGIAQLDVTSVPAAERERVADGVIADQAARPFAIATEPCIRCVVLRLASDCHRVLLVAHHLAVDTWSMGILSAELFSVYDALVERRAWVLPELELQYADYAAWASEADNQRATATQLRYWEEKLRNAAELQRLPIDRPREARRAPQPRTEAFAISAPLTTRIDALARAEGVSLFTLLLAALKVLLYRHTGQADVIVGSAVSNRKRPELEPLIGCFMNTVVFRTLLSPALTFRDCLRRVRQTVLEAHENSDAPFEDVVSALKPPRNLSYSPYTQVMLIVQNADLGISTRSALSVRRLPVAERLLAQQDLVWHVRAGDGCLRGLAEFDAALFDAETVGALCARLEEILKAATANPDSRLGDLNIMTAADRRAYRALSAACAAPSHDRPSAAYAVFREAKVASDRIAVTCGDRALSYGGLDARARDLSARLAALRVGAGTVVAVCATRSPEMIAALVAVHRRGAAYVAIDASLSPARARAIIRHAAAAVVITEERLRPWFDTLGEPVVILGGDAGAHGGGDDVVSEPGPRSIAAVIESAGVSGRPARVACPYAWLEAGSAALTRAGIVTRDDALLVATPPESPAFAADVFAALAAGARVALTPQCTVNGAEYWSWIDEMRCNVVLAPPLVLRAMAAAEGAALRGVRVVCRGDVLPADVGAAVRAQGGSAFAAYSSSEVGPVVFCTPFTPHDPAAIGWAAPWTQCHVLDAHLNPVPPGVPGHLYFSGSTVVDGYLGNPSLSAARFVPNPLARYPGERLFQTGDLALYRHDGTVRVLGRQREDVLLGGRPVDPGYIECVLRSHPSIQQAIVVARATPRGTRLAAYVVPTPAASSDSPDLSSRDVREFLLRQLPSALVPEDVVIRSSFLLGRHGFIDRRELPEPPPAPGAIEYQPPSSSTEKALAAIWGELLEHHPIGTRDDFFDLGGDSMLVQRMVAKIEAALGISVPMHVAFSTPTIGDLADHVDRLRKLRSTDDEELADLVSALTDDEVRALLSGAAAAGGGAG